MFCLGLCNPWGNVWTWVFGASVISTGGDTPSVEMYIKASNATDGSLQFDDYNHSATTGDSGNYVTSSGSGYSTNKTYLTSRGYVQVGSSSTIEVNENADFDLPESGDYYTYFGVAQTDETNRILSLIGMPSGTATASESSGFTDFYYVNTSDAYRYGVFVGSCADATTRAGAFSFAVSYNLAHPSVDVGFRPALFA